MNNGNSSKTAQKLSVKLQDEFPSAKIGFFLRSLTGSGEEMTVSEYKWPKMAQN